MKIPTGLRAKTAARAQCARDKRDREDYVQNIPMKPKNLYKYKESK